MISQVDRFLSLSLCKKWAHLPEVCGGIYIKQHILAPQSGQVSLHIYKHPAAQEPTFPATSLGIFSLKFYSISVCFLDMYMGLDNTVWVQLENSGGGEIIPTRHLFHFFVFQSRQAQGQGETGKVGAVQEPARETAGALPLKSAVPT